TTSTGAALVPSSSATYSASSLVQVMSPHARAPSGSFHSAASCSSTREITRTASARGTIGIKSTRPSPAFRSVGPGIGEAGGDQLRLRVPAVRRVLVLRPPRRALRHPLLAQLDVRLVDVVGAEVDAAARADRVRRRSRRVDVRLGEIGIPAHRARELRGLHSGQRMTPDFLSRRIRAHASATTAAALIGSKPRGLMLETTSRSASVAPLAGR